MELLGATGCSNMELLGAAPAKIWSCWVQLTGEKGQIWSCWVQLESYKPFKINGLTSKSTALSFYPLFIS
jgi:hypothetical protein